MTSHRFRKLLGVNELVRRFPQKHTTASTVDYATVQVKQSSICYWVNPKTTATGSYSYCIHEIATTKTAGKACFVDGSNGTR
jgi:hypothetical protein